MDKVEVCNSEHIEVALDEVWHELLFAGLKLRLHEYLGSLKIDQGHH